MGACVRTLARTVTPTLKPAGIRTLYSQVGSISPRDNKVKKAGVREEGAKEPGVCSVSVGTITARILSRALAGWLILREDLELRMSIAWLWGRAWFYPQHRTNWV